MLKLFKSVYDSLILIMLFLLRKSNLRYFSLTLDPKFGTSSRIGGNSEEKLFELYAGRFENKHLENYKKDPLC